ncbi:hypothetical protein NDU88_005138, partial [Pleurodeles waltl]
ATSAARGRPSGGLVVWAKISLNVEIRMQATESEDILWLTMGKKNKIITHLFNVYIRPRKS